MAAVIDANLLVALVTGDPRRALVAAQFKAWDEAEEPLHAPSLILYEVANALTGLLAAELIADADSTRSGEPSWICRSPCIS